LIESLSVGPSNGLDHCCESDRGHTKLFWFREEKALTKPMTKHMQNNRNKP